MTPGQALENPYDAYMQRSPFFDATRRLASEYVNQIYLENEQRLMNQLVEFGKQDGVFPLDASLEQIKNMAFGTHKKEVQERYIQVQVVGQWERNLARNPRYGNYDSDNWWSP